MNWIVFPNQKFTLGQVVSTPGALDLIDQNQINLIDYLRRHAQGDWGDMNEEDKLENALSLEKNYRLFSAYKTDVGKIWIITEADRSATTIILPAEY